VLLVGAAAAAAAAFGTLRAVAPAASFAILLYYAVANLAALRMPRAAKLYPDAALRPQGYAIPEHYAGQPPEAYRRAKFGPFRNVNEDY